MTDQEIYRRFIAWLDEQGLPIFNPEEMIPMVKAAFTPGEAALLTGIPFRGGTLEELAELKQMAPEELKERLDVLAGKGAIFRTARGDTLHYRLKDTAFIFYRAMFWPPRADARSAAVAPLATQSYSNVHDVFKYIQQKPLRVLPVEGTIEDTRQIYPFEAAARVLDAKSYFCVSACACRHRMELDPNQPNCRHSLETCLHFDDLGRYMVENKLGREITREEAGEILRRSAEEGLMPALENALEDADTICNCCPCCCSHFHFFHKLGHAEAHNHSNYRLRTNPELCIGCGLCVRRCPMDALRLEDAAGTQGRVTAVSDDKGRRKELRNKSGKVAVVNPEICLGCGVCAYKCQTKSLVLERREVITQPPGSQRERYLMAVKDLEEVGLRQPKGK